ncbi:MAG: hypothetical protein A4E64_00351 [Syntrophorhabdus sp. PtaU1.Bin058]|nr:MAG: hypothetical protein A4E64_00351 [Syntrophorhabdus sp. PtaU1.Bin058]
MTKSSNNRGIALVLLIMSITIIGVIGAGIVSLVGSKHRAYPFQTQSYQAYTLANAGVEFAIRYAHDNWIAFSAGPSTYIPNITPANCTTTHPNIKNVKDSSNNTLFYLCYDSTIGSPTYDQLTSIGIFGNAQRKIVLSHFQTYANH